MNSIIMILSLAVIPAVVVWHTIAAERKARREADARRAEVRALEHRIQGERNAWFTLLTALREAGSEPILMQDSSADWEEAVLCELA